ncbi:hypothetical protein OHV93_17805 [Acinetobacter baumannii]|uniref:hypothetical protein n=2 Tax=Acinetobacter baumannii TaxID=470 RepID=UPI0023426812|nr:hypothetical protein [Acinetobacter baumannii]MDC4919813.1 hypothetical protein [Acinetobacter baumannii]MDC4934260.1 hypothetical protein [Acinetobacter baumannii]MDV7374990.1 hypothetical protein [Acinetobacter baumannii]MDV7677297.1 hypothetical protein [Acinetobacter baumannii]MEB6637093.1 hypothetical protein [Acinetobacter baumannii]
MKRKILGFIIGALVSLLFIILLLALGYAIENNEKFIPVVVGLMSVFSGLGGVWITNYFNSKNHKDRLDFDLMQKERERIHSLRKDIYLHAADAMVEFQSTIGKISDIDFDINESNKLFNKFCLAMNRLQLIANVTTTKQTILVISKCSKSYFKIIKERKELIRMNAEIDAIDPFVLKLQSNIDNILELIKNNRNSINYDEKYNEKLLLEFNRYEDKRKELVTNKVELMRKRALEVNRLGRLILEENNNNIQEMNNLHVFLRLDINGIDNIEEYRNTIFSNSNEANSLIKEILDDYEKEYR